MTRRSRLLAAVTALVLIAAGAVTWLVAGRSSDAPLDFSAAGAAMAGARLHPGQAESYAAFLTAKPAGVRFTISHLALIPLPGWRTPQLLGAEFLIQRRVPLEAGGYPPRNNDGTLVPVHPTSGYTEVSGAAAHRIQDVLMVGLRGSALGAYATAGVRITYQAGGTIRTTDIYNAAFLYYYPRNQTPAQRKASLKDYSALNDRATAALQKLPGVQAVMAEP